MARTAKGKAKDHGGRWTEVAKGVWKWVKGDISLTPALKKQASTLSHLGVRGGSRRDRALTGRPAPDVIAKAWEWVVGEQPLESPKKQKSKRFKIPKLGKLKKFAKVPRWKKKSKPAHPPEDEAESGLVGEHRRSSALPDSPHHSDADSEFGTDSDQDDDESDDEIQYHSHREPNHPPPDYTSRAPTSR